MHHLLKCEIAPTSTVSENTGKHIRNRRYNALKHTQAQNDRKNKVKEEYTMTCISSGFSNPHLASLQGTLANEFKVSYGCSIAVANSMAQTADEIYRQSANLTKPGNILYSAVHVCEPSGKPLSSCKRIHVKLTLWCEDDQSITDMKSHKMAVFRRIAQEAYDQDGVLTIEDCENIMLTSIRTLKEYIQEFKKQNIILPLRGYIHSTGRGQTHKTEIICFYLDGMPFSDLQFKTYHSMEAIARYIKMFSRVIICHVNQNMPVKDIAKVVDISPELVGKYLEIYAKYTNEQNERLDLILNPAEFDNYILPFKKKAIL